RRVCWTSSLNTRLPNDSVARGPRGSLASVTDQSRIELIASPSTAEPMTSPLSGNEHAQSAAETPAERSIISRPIQACIIAKFLRTKQHYRDKVTKLRHKSA